MIDDSRPIFQQIAEQIENDIVDGALPEGTQAPSTNELAAFFRINPATAAKGINQLVAEEILYKKRGIGMFVADGARKAIIDKRRAAFAKSYLEPMLAEAHKLGLTHDHLIDLIRNGGEVS